MFFFLFCEITLFPTAGFGCGLWILNNYIVYPPITQARYQPIMYILQYNQDVGLYKIK